MSQWCTAIDVTTHHMTGESQQNDSEAEAEQEEEHSHTDLTSLLAQSHDWINGAVE